jgi:hypothetical protein
MYARYALTAGCAVGSIVGVWLLGAEVVAAVAGDFEAVGFATSPPPHAVVAKTAAASAAAIRFCFINA